MLALFNRFRPCDAGVPGQPAKVTRIMKRAGAGSAELPAAGAGDIVSIAGIAGVGIADTICSPSVEQGLPPGHIEPPTLRYHPGSALSENSAHR